MTQGEHSSLATSSRLKAESTSVLLDGADSRRSEMGGSRRRSDDLGGGHMMVASRRRGRSRDQGREHRSQPGNLCHISEVKGMPALHAAGCSDLLARLDTSCDSVYGSVYDSVFLRGPQGRLVSSSSESTESFPACPACDRRDDACGNVSVSSHNVSVSRQDTGDGMTHNVSLSDMNIEFLHQHSQKSNVPLCSVEPMNCPEKVRRVTRSCYSELGSFSQPSTCETMSVESGAVVQHEVSTPGMDGDPQVTFTAVPDVE